MSLHKAFRPADWVRPASVYKIWLGQPRPYRGDSGAAKKQGNTQINVSSSNAQSFNSDLALVFAGLGSRNFMKDVDDSLTYAIARWSEHMKRHVIGQNPNVGTEHEINWE